MRAVIRISETFLAEREGGVPRGSSRTLGDPPWGLSLSAKTVFENLEKVPTESGSRRSWRSEILNASNNDYWVAWTSPHAELLGACNGACNSL